MPQPICQSCGMPMQKSEDFGKNADGSASAEYCRYCFQNGKYTVDMTLEQFIEKNVEIAKSKLGMSEADARAMATSVIPNLKRWKKLGN
ncbi:MAG: zinc ribbon domain-containing protein [Patescibacteria group bacterium]|nr:zinc ribbon domain-containing protein [Patescibacteria group bacterium]